MRVFDARLTALLVLGACVSAHALPDAPLSKEQKKALDGALRQVESVEKRIKFTLEKELGKAKRMTNTSDLARFTAGTLTAQFPPIEEDLKKAQAAIDDAKCPEGHAELLKTKERAATAGERIAALRREIESLKAFAEKASDPASYPDLQKDMATLEKTVADAQNASPGDPEAATKLATIRETLPAQKETAESCRPKYTAFLTSGRPEAKALNDAIPRALGAIKTLEKALTDVPNSLVSKFLKCNAQEQGQGNLEMQGSLAWIEALEHWDPARAKACRAHREKAMQELRDKLAGQREAHIAGFVTRVTKRLDDLEAIHAKAAKEANHDGLIRLPAQLEEPKKSHGELARLFGTSDPRVPELGRRIEALQAKFEADAVQAKKDKLAAARAPAEKYAGPDKEALRKSIHAEWKKEWPKDEVLEVRLQAQAWERRTEWTWVRDGWVLSDMSYYRAVVIVKTSDAVATCYVAVANKDHTKADAVTIGVKTKTGAWEAREVLLENLNK